MEWTVVDGINEPELKSLSMEILDYLERIVEIFDQIEIEIDSLPESYKSVSYDKFLSFYNDFKRNYIVVKNNINSYSEELITLISRMHENEGYLINMFEGYITDKKSKAKDVEYKEVL